MNFAWGLRFWRNSLLPEGTSPEEVGKHLQNNDCLSKICRSLKTGVRSAGVNGQSTKRFIDFVLYFRSQHSSSDPCGCPDICGWPSITSFPINFSFPWNKRSLNTGLSEDGFEEPLRPPSSWAGTFLINKTFLPPNSDILNIVLLKHQAHRLWIHNTVMRIERI